MTHSIVFLHQRDNLLMWATAYPVREAAIACRLGGVSLDQSLILELPTRDAAKALHSLLLLAMPAAGRQKMSHLWEPLSTYPLVQYPRMRQLLEHLADLHPYQAMPSAELVSAVEAERIRTRWAPKPVPESRLQEIRRRQENAELETEARARRSVDELQSIRYCCDTALVLRREKGYMLLGQPKHDYWENVREHLDTLMSYGFVDEYQQWDLNGREIFAALLSGRPGLPPEEAPNYWTFYDRLVWASTEVELPGMDQEIPMSMYPVAQALLEPYPHIYHR